MKKFISVFHNDRSIFFNIPFLKGIAGRNSFIFLFLLFTAGIVLSVILCDMVDAEALVAIPLLPSGIPVPETGIFSCFSSFLVNEFLNLLLLFFMGLTAYGSFIVPVFVLFRGFVIGIITRYLISGDFFTVFECMLIYSPGTAFGAFYVILAACSAYRFSKRFRIFGNNAFTGDIPVFSKYCRDFLSILICAVVTSFICSLPVVLL